MTSSLRPTAAMGLVYAATVAMMTSYSLLAVALPFRFEELGLSVVQYGITLSIFALGMLVTESIWGVLAFRIGSPRTVLVVGILVIATYAAISLSRNFVDLAVSLGLLGALVIFPVPLMRWMALTALGPGTSGRGTGIYGLFFGVGLVTGSALGPLIFVDLGFGSLMLLVLATYGVGLGLIVLLPWGRVALPDREYGLLGQVRDVFTRPFALAAALVVLAFIVQTLPTNFLQYYSVSVFHGTPSDAGYVIGSARATSLIAGAALGFLVDRWGAIRTAPAGFILLTVGAVGSFFSASYAEMLGSTLVLAVGTGWLSASLLPLALGPIPAPRQGTAVGVFGSFEDLGLLVGPILISAVYAGAGVGPTFLIVAAVAAVGAACCLMLRRTAPRRPDAAGSIREFRESTYPERR